MGWVSKLLGRISTQPNLILFKSHLPNIYNVNRKYCFRYQQRIHPMFATEFQERYFSNNKLKFLLLNGIECNKFHSIKAFKNSSMKICIQSTAVNM